MYTWKRFCFIIHFIPHFDFILITRAEQIKLIWKVKLKHLYIAKICNSRNSIILFFVIEFLCHELARSRGAVGFQINCFLFHPFFIFREKLNTYFTHCHFQGEAEYLFHLFSFLGRSWIPLCRHWTTQTLWWKSSNQ